MLARVVSDPAPDSIADRLHLLHPRLHAPHSVDQLRQAYPAVRLLQVQAQHLPDFGSALAPDWTLARSHSS